MDEQLNKYMNDIHVEMVNHIKKYDEGFENFTCSLKLDWSQHRVSSRGGWYKAGPGVNYSMIQLQHDINSGKFIEYASFAKDKIIGNFTSNDPMMMCYALSCHELAHAAIGYLDKNNKERHGPRWKDMYAKYRNIYVNSYVDNLGEVIEQPKNRTEETELERNNFVKLAHKKGLNSNIKLDDILHDIKGNTTIQIKGWNSKARLYPIIVYNVDKKIIFKYPVSYINQFTKKVVNGNV